MRLSLVLLPLFIACDPSTTIDAQTYDPGQVIGAVGAADEGSMDTQPVPSATSWRNPAGQVLVAFTEATGGRWIWPGQEPGMASGDAACQALGADHVCSYEDLMAAEDAGDLRRAPANISLWLFEEGLPTREASCANFTYEGAHQKWSGNARTVPDEQGGTRLAYDFPPASRWDDACLSDPEQCPAVVPSGYACNERRAIACCK